MKNPQVWAIQFDWNDWSKSNGGCLLLRGGRKDVVIFSHPISLSNLLNHLAPARIANLFQFSFICKMGKSLKQVPINMGNPVDERTVTNEAYS